MNTDAIDLNILSCNAAHNQVRAVISSFLNDAVVPEWKMYEETPMAKTGRVLRPTALATIDQLGRRQPDWILVSDELKGLLFQTFAAPRCMMTLRQSVSDLVMPWSRLLPGSRPPRLLRWAPVSRQVPSSTVAKCMALARFFRATV